MKLSIEQNIRFGSYLALALLLIIGGIAYFSAQRSILAFRSVDHSHQVTDELGNINLSLLNAEAAARSYAFSGDEPHLKPQQSAVAAIEAARKRLRTLTKDDASQQKRLDGLDPLVAKKLGLIATSIQDRKTSGFNAANKTLASAQSTKLTDDIHHVLAQMESTERRLLNERSASAQLEARTLISFVILGSVAAMTLVALAAMLVRRDLRKRREAEEERDRFFNLSRDLLCIASFDGFFQRLSPVWEQTLGFTLDELMSAPFIEYVHPEDRPRTLAEAGKLTAGGEVIFFENRYRRKDGAWRWFSWSARSSTQARMIYAIARDVTEQRQAALQIVQLNADLRNHASQLEAANKELEAFSYSVSHDLRAPLRHIGGFVDLLGKHSAQNLDSNAKRYLGFIASAVKQMGRLVDDLLSFSRMARSELRHTEVSLEQLVAEIRAGLQADLEGRETEWSIGSLPDVMADQPMLRIAMTNLISNAVKYTRPREHARIEIGALPDPNEHIIFVRDNGVGFDMQYSSKLFGVFQRLHSEDEFEGTGIGLANVRRIVLRHGGRAWAEAREGHGATFYVSLPKSPSAQSTLN